MLSDWGHWLISRIMGGLTFYFCPYKTIAVRFCGRTGHVYKIESSLPLKPPPPKRLTAGQMGWCQSPGFELLWHSFSCPLPPAMAPTANHSPVRSFKGLAKLLIEQSLKDECPCLLGRSKIAQTPFPANTWNLLTWRTAMSSWWASQGLSEEPTATPHWDTSSSGYPWKL